MSVEKVHFGTFEQKEITLYKISNANGIEVSVMNYGLTITSIKLPDGDNIVCGFDNFESYFTSKYKANSPYFGGVIGRYCATIRPGKFDNYELSKNAGENTLHGGIVGFDKKVWTLDNLANDAITFSLHSEDGDQGFPGNVDVMVKISLSDDNALTFNYLAKTDKRTPLSMTNHTYFNLSGFAENIEGHSVMVNSIETFAMDAEGDYDANRTSVEGEITDLRIAKSIADLHKEVDGMEHFYLYEGGIAPKRKVAEFAYAAKNRKVEVFTTEPGMLLYTAKYTSGELARESGEQYGKYCALCCETHRVPNGPNLNGASYIFTEANEKFESETTFKFTI